jgi:hypothetical protein
LQSHDRCIWAEGKVGPGSTECLCADQNHEIVATVPASTMIQQANLESGKKTAALGLDSTTRQQLKLAEDPETGESTLRWLLTCPSFQVRQAAAWNPNIFPMDLDALENDPVPGVRGAVAQRTQSPTVLKRLLEDGNMTVRESARRNEIVKDMDKAELESWMSEVKPRAEIKQYTLRQSSKPPERPEGPTTPQMKE